MRDLSGSNNGKLRQINTKIFEYIYKKLRKGYPKVGKIKEPSMYTNFTNGAIMYTLIRSRCSLQGSPLAPQLGVKMYFIFDYFEVVASSLAPSVKVNINTASLHKKGGFNLRPTSGMRDQNHPSYRPAIFGVTVSSDLCLYPISLFQEFGLINDSSFGWSKPEVCSRGLMSALDVCFKGLLRMSAPTWRDLLEFSHSPDDLSKLCCRCAKLRNIADVDTCLPDPTSDEVIMSNVDPIVVGKSFDLVQNFDLVLSFDYVQPFNLVRSFDQRTRKRVDPSVILLPHVLPTDPDHVIQDALAQGAEGLGLMQNEDHQVLGNEQKLEEDP
ncbi:hypothetical protein Tco_1546780 [Tanacetum coccineum]